MPEGCVAKKRSTPFLQVFSREYLQKKQICIIINKIETFPEKEDFQ